MLRAMDPEERDLLMEFRNLNFVRAIENNAETAPFMKQPDFKEKLEDIQVREGGR
jgi:hypothetical protein